MGTLFTPSDLQTIVLKQDDNEYYLYYITIIHQKSSIVDSSNKCTKLQFCVFVGSAAQILFQSQFYIKIMSFKVQITFFLLIPLVLSFTAQPFCQSCLYDCYTCDSQSSCLTYNENNDFRYMNETLKRCLPLPGYFDNLVAVCVPCLPQCLTCLSLLQCVICANGYILTRDNRCVKQCVISYSFFDSPQICQNCPSDCATCDLYYFDDGSFVCKKCIDHCEMCMSQTDCFQAQFGYKFDRKVGACIQSQELTIKQKVVRGVMASLGAVVGMAMVMVIFKKVTAFQHARELQKLRRTGKHVIVQQASKTQIITLE